MNFVAVFIITISFSNSAQACLATDHAIEIFRPFLNIVQGKRYTSSDAILRDFDIFSDLTLSRIPASFTKLKRQYKYHKFQQSFKSFLSSIESHPSSLDVRSEDLWSKVLSTLQIQMLDSNPQKMTPFFTEVHSDIILHHWGTLQETTAWKTRLTAHLATISAGKGLRKILTHLNPDTTAKIETQSRIIGMLNDSTQSIENKVSMFYDFFNPTFLSTLLLPEEGKRRELDKDTMLDLQEYILVSSLLSVGDPFTLAKNIHEMRVLEKRLQTYEQELYEINLDRLTDSQQGRLYKRLADVGSLRGVLDSVLRTIK